MSFDKIFGHDEIKQRLSEIILHDRLSHAYIFCGPDGVGKTAVALEWAKMITGGENADIKLITNDEYADSVKKSGKTAALSVDTVRAAGTDMYIRPYAAEKRVFIIPDGDSMTVSAQNALLKVFEEPPHYCVIIIIAGNDKALLQTIRSRAVTVRFGDVKSDVIESFLKQRGISPDPVIIAAAGGSIGRALELSEDEAAAELAKKTIELTARVYEKKAAYAYDLISFLLQNKEQKELIFNTICAFFHISLLQDCEKNVTMPIRGISAAMAAQSVGLLERCRKSLVYNGNYNMAVNELVLGLLSV